MNLSNPSISSFIAQNAPGSFALFGGNSMAKSYMMVSEEQTATWTEDALASCAGAIASITVAQPLDVVKVRTMLHCNGVCAPLNFLRRN